jgi:hypothetical protein
MEAKIDIFNVKVNEEPFGNPLDNIFFTHYLRELRTESYDSNRLYYDNFYLQRVYEEYLDSLVEYCRPEFPPLYLNVEEDLTFDKKPVKDITKNTGNSFMIYRQYLVKHIEKTGIKISNQQKISPLASRLWNTEPKEVKAHYKRVSDKRKKLREDRLNQYFPNEILGKRKRSPGDDDDEANHKHQSKHSHLLN